MRLKTERKENGYVVSSMGGPKLSRQYMKYGILGDHKYSLNSLNSEERGEMPPNPKEQRFIYLVSMLVNRRVHPKQSS
jgi:hypothetical protein